MEADYKVKLEVFEGPLDLLLYLIKKEEVAGPCIISKFYASSLGRTAITLDGTALDHLSEQFAAGGNKVDQLLVNLVTSDSFRFVEPPK